MYSSQYLPSDVLVSVREPYNKNTIWIKPYDEYLEVKMFDSGWKTIYTTLDLGLSKLSETQVKNLIDSLQKNFQDKLIKYTGKFNNNFITLQRKCKNLESTINELESKFDKLLKKYLILITKK